MTILLVFLLAAFAQSHGANDEELSLEIEELNVSAYPHVRCTVSVSDSSGNSVQGLSTDEFRVMEEGQSLEALRCEAERPDEQDMAVVLVIDRSGSMKGGALEAAKDAAEDFIERLGPADLCGLVAFSTIGASLVAPATARAGLHETINGLIAGGDTDLYDAIPAGLHMLKRTNARRKAVVLLTDGRDTASVRTFGGLQHIVANTAIAVHAIGLGDDVNRDVLRKLAVASHGSYSFTSSPSALLLLFRKILTNIRTRYCISYVSPEVGDNARWRNVCISVQYGDQLATDKHDYVIPSGLQQPTRWPGVSPFLLLVLIVAAIDVALVVLLWRKRAR